MLLWTSYRLVPLAFVLSLLHSSCAAPPKSEPIEHHRWMGNWIAVSSTTSLGLPKDFLNPRDSLLLSITEHTVQLHDLSRSNESMSGTKWGYELSDQNQQLTVNHQNERLRLKIEPGPSKTLWLVEYAAPHAPQIAGVRFRPVNAQEAQQFFLTSNLAKTWSSKGVAMQDLPRLHEKDFHADRLIGHWQLVGFRSEGRNLGLGEAFATPVTPVVTISLTADSVVQHLWYQGILTVVTRPHRFEGTTMILGSEEKAAKIHWLSASEQFLYLDPVVFRFEQILERYQRIDELPDEIRAQSPL